MPQASLTDWFAEDTIKLIALICKDNSENETIPITVLNFFNTLKENTNSLETEEIQLLQDCISQFYDQSVVDRECDGKSLFSSELQGIIKETRELAQMMGFDKIEMEHFWLPLIKWIRIQLAPNYDKNAQISEIEVRIIKSRVIDPAPVFKRFGVTIQPELISEDGKVRCTLRLLNVLQMTQCKAKEMDSKNIGLEHIIYTLIVCNLHSEIEIMRRISYPEVNDLLVISSKGRKSAKNKESVLQKTLNNAVKIAKDSKSSKLDFQHLGLAILEEEDPLVEKTLEIMKIKKEVLLCSLQHCLVNSRADQPIELTDLSKYR